MRKARALMIVGAGLGLTLIAKLYKLRKVLLVDFQDHRTKYVKSLLGVTFIDPNSTERHRMVRISLRQDSSNHYLLKHVTIRHGLGFFLHRPQEILGETDLNKSYMPRTLEKSKRLESRQMSVRHRRILETDTRFVEASFFVSIPTRSPLHPTPTARLRLNVMLEELSSRKRTKQIKVVSTYIPWTGGASTRSEVLDSNLKGDAG